IEFTGVSDLAAPPAPAAPPAAHEPVRIVMVGWSAFGSQVLRQLDEVLPDGSPVDVVADVDLVAPPPVQAAEMVRATHGALASLLMAQLSERADLQAVFDDLFDAEGAVVDLVAAEKVVPLGARPWAEVVAAAGAGGMSAFGHRSGGSGVVTVNPPKSSI